MTNEKTLRIEKDDFLKRWFTWWRKERHKSEYERNNPGLKERAVKTMSPKQRAHLDMKIAKTEEHLLTLYHQIPKGDVFELTPEPHCPRCGQRMYDNSTEKTGLLKRIFGNGVRIKK